MMNSGVDTPSWNSKAPSLMGRVAQYLSCVSRFAKSVLFGALLASLGLIIMLVCAGTMMALIIMAGRDHLRGIRT
jgi:hypothetical protein